MLELGYWLESKRPRRLLPLSVVGVSVGGASTTGGSVGGASTTGGSVGGASTTAVLQLGALPLAVLQLGAVPLAVLQLVALPPLGLLSHLHQPLQTGLRSHEVIRSDSMTISEMIFKKLEVGFCFHKTSAFS